MEDIKRFIKENWWAIIALACAVLWTLVLSRVAAAQAAEIACWIWKK